MMTLVVVFGKIYGCKMFLMGMEVVANESYDRGGESKALFHEWFS